MSAFRVIRQNIYIYIYEFRDYSIFKFSKQLIERSDHEFYSNRRNFCNYLILVHLPCILSAIKVRNLKQPKTNSGTCIVFKSRNVEVVSFFPCEGKKKKVT